MEPGLVATDARQGGAATGWRAALTPRNARVLLIAYAVSLIVFPGWVVAGTVLGWPVYESGDDFIDAEFGAYLLLQLGTVAAGGIIALRRPGQLVGWLLLLAGTSFMCAWLLIIPYDIFASLDLEAATGVVEGVFFGIATMWLILIFAALFYFPDGRLISPRWRFASWVYPAALVAGIAASIVNGGWGGDQDEVRYPSPLRTVVDPLGDVLAALFVVALPIVVLMAFLAIAVRFVRSEGVERQQMKMLLFAAVTAAVILPIVTGLTGGAALDGPFQTFVVMATVLLIPLAILFAIMRYGLYEIDRIISRTVAYAIVVVVLATLFVAGVVVLPILLPTDGSNLAVAATTLAVAALFNPVRRRTLRTVDRVFNRSRYDHEKVNARLAAQLRDEIDGDRVLAGLLAMVGTTMQPASASVWIRNDHNGTRNGAGTTRR